MSPRTNGAGSVHIRRSRPAQKLHQLDRLSSIMYRAIALVSFIAAGVGGQQVGTLVPEVHPPLPIQKCAKGGTCTTEATTVVLDANWRWLHNAQGQNCYTGNTWSTTACPDPVTCAANCALDGAQYASTYGITTTGSSLSIGFVTGANVGSRNYLMASPTQYEMFMLMNQEFTFDVDVSNLPCGLNGALYFSQMPADGGASATNKAGAGYGTGYCDAQCPQDIKFINGKVLFLLSFFPQARCINFQFLGQHSQLDPRFQQCQHRKRGEWRMLLRDGHLGGQQPSCSLHSPCLRPTGSVRVRWRCLW